MANEKKKPPVKAEDELKCPKGFPLADWLMRNDAAKRAYLRAIEHSNKLTQKKGGEK